MSRSTALSRVITSSSLRRIVSFCSLILFKARRTMFSSSSATRETLLAASPTSKRLCPFAQIQGRDTSARPHRSAINPRPRRRGHRMNRRELLLLLGGALTAARGLHAQRKAMPVIGFLGSTSPGPNEPALAAFRQGLSETGYVEGQNVAIEYRWAEGRYDRLPALAADLVARKVDVIAITGGNASVRAAKNATTTIPIVSTLGDDPVELGLVASLARPGGNLTGINMITAELMPKRLEPLSELAPRAGVIALLANPGAESMIREVQEAARVKGVQLQILKASSESEIDAAFASP